MSRGWGQATWRWWPTVGVRPVLIKSDNADAKLVTSHMAASPSSRKSLPERGVRLTRQRKILLDLIDKTGQHLDAERLYQMAKEKDPKLNRVTVYKTKKPIK